MATSTTVPAHSSPSPSLSDQLDSLLSRYLTLLDTHEKLRASAQASFRSGIFSLTEANFRAPNRSTRYGQDLYDDKMQASLILEYPKDSVDRPSDLPNANNMRSQTSSRSEDSTAAIRTWAKRLPTASASAGKPRPSEEEEQGEDEKQTTGNGEKRQNHDDTNQRDHEDEPQFPTPPITREQTPNAAGTKGVESATSLPRDPIRQFGVLVPQSLKTAQVSFGKATESWIECSWRNRELAMLELEIRRARKRLRKVEEQTSVTG